MVAGVVESIPFVKERVGGWCLVDVMVMVEKRVRDRRGERGHFGKEKRVDRR